MNRTQNNRPLGVTSSSAKQVATKGTPGADIIHIVMHNGRMRKDRLRQRIPALAPHVEHPDRAVAL